jgi:hypothetical protein
MMFDIYKIEPLILAGKDSGYKVLVKTSGPKKKQLAGKEPLHRRVVASEMCSADAEVIAQACNEYAQRRWRCYVEAHHLQDLLNMHEE